MSFQGCVSEAPASPYLRSSDQKFRGYFEADLESNDSSASSLSCVTASSSIADTMSNASYATAPSRHSTTFCQADVVDASLEMQARALAEDPDSIIESLTRCEVLASTNLPRAIHIAKDIMDTCIELLSETHVFIMPIRTTLGSLYIKAELFELAEIHLQAAYLIWLDHQSDENQGLEQILFPLGVAQLALKKHKEAEESLRNCMITQLSFLNLETEECMSTIEMLSVATVHLGMIEDSRALLDCSLEYRCKNSFRITSLYEGQASCLGNVFMTSLALLNLYLSNDQADLGISFLRTVSRFLYAEKISDKDSLMDLVGPARKLASMFSKFDDLGAAEGVLSSWLSKSESLLGYSHPVVLQLMFDLSQNYALQSRDDEAEALSSAASERFKLEFAESDILASKSFASFHLNSTQSSSAALKLLPSDIDIWCDVIQKLNLLPSVTSRQILQNIVRLNLASPDDALRMSPYATHLKVAAFDRMRKS